MHVSKDTGSSSCERKIFRPSVIFFFLDISNISASEQEVWRGFYLTGLSVDCNVKLFPVIYANYRPMTDDRRQTETLYLEKG
jgi:hypothetical protein